MCLAAALQERSDEIGPDAGDGEGLQMLRLVQLVPKLIAQGIANLTL